MNRQNKVRYPVILIFFLASSLIFTSLINTADREARLNKKINHENQQNVINNQIPNRYFNGKNETMSIYYGLLANGNYEYEFRFKLNPSIKNGDHRLMLILYGAKRICDDMWDFSVGIRILTAMHDFGYSILAICPQKRTYDSSIPIAENKDVKFVYLSLQSWMNTIYYSWFKRYPLLYIHATSRGSKFAGVLCRVLPIQAQLLYIFPGHRRALIMPSDYDSDMQTRLISNSTFANWFYFDFCLDKANKKLENQTLCPFQSDHNYFYPVPPTFFTCLKADPYQKEIAYDYFIKKILANSVNLGGILLNQTGAVLLDTLPPLQPTISYMQENFHIWYSKSQASRLFFEHYNNPEKYNVIDSNRKVCWCSKIDFKYYERMPNITIKWSRKKQDEYSNYVRDIRKYQNAFCEEVCGDLMTTHAMVSRNINKTLHWITKIDQLRSSIFRSNLTYFSSPK